MRDLLPANDALPPSDSAKILKGSEFEILSRAQADIETAQQQAEAILADAREEAERLKAEAREEGQREGARIAAEFGARVARDLDGVESRLTGIVMDTLRRVLDPIPPEKLIVAALRRAVADIDLSRGATLVVAPELLPRVRAQLARFPIADEALELNGDPACPPDSTILRTPYGDVELNVDAQLDAIAAGFDAALAEKAG